MTQHRRIRLRQQLSRTLRVYLAALAALSLGFSSCTTPPNDSLRFQDLTLEVIPTDNATAITSQGLSEVTFGNISQPTVINLWATWCAPCRTELADFDTVARTRTDISLLGVNVGEEPEVASGLLDELDISYVNVADREAQLSQALALTGLPVTVFVNRDTGSDANSKVRVVHTHIGVLNAQELEELIDIHLTK